MYNYAVKEVKTIKLVTLEWRHFENAKKRDFHKNSHFEMAVSPKLRNQMQFSYQHFKGLQKTFRIPVGESIYLQISIFGVFLSATLLTTSCCA